MPGDEALLYAASRLPEWYPGVRIYRCYYTEFVVEVGDLPVVVVQLPSGCETRIATVDGQVDCSVRRGDRKILLALEQAMIEASQGGTEIRCHLG